MAREQDGQADGKGGGPLEFVPTSGGFEIIVSGEDFDTFTVP